MIRPTTHPAGARSIQRPVKAVEHDDNDFLFGTEDPEALRCPFGAHIRRANPRDSLDPGSQDQIDISNRHRIIRVGRQYVPENGQKPGLLFMCLNGDIERQFEFVQQTWLMSPSFHGLSHEKDALIGDGKDNDSGFTIASRDGPLRLQQVPQVVTTRGGGYFFLPGKRLIDYLCVPL
jgi:deferrochelatase/peroxidase EfeB